MAASSSKTNTHTTENVSDSEVDRISSNTMSTNEKSTIPPPFSVGFFDRDPDTTRRRGMYLKVLGLGTFLTIIVIFAVLSVYWGSLWRTNVYIHNMDVWLVDFDGGAMGTAVREAAANISGPSDQLTWTVKDASEFPNGVSDIIDAVVNERTWGVVAINAGATQNLTTAISNLDASYNGSLAVTAYTNEARNENSYAIFYAELIQIPLVLAAQQFAVQNAKQIAAGASGATNFQNLLSNAPSTVTQPLYFTIDVVRPFDIWVATAVDFVGLIYLLIIAFIIAMMNFNARNVISGLGHQLHLRDLLVLRLVSPVILYFFLAWFYSLLSLAFQVPFNRRFGASGFVIYWAMNWMGMCALGLAMEAMITLLTPAFVPFFLVLWIIANVSVSFYPLELLPPIFRYGYAMPFYNVSRTVRTILFSTRNQVGLNFGVQISWILVSFITITIFQVVRRRLDVRHVKQDQLLGVNETVEKQAAEEDV